MAKILENNAAEVEKLNLVFFLLFLFLLGLFWIFFRSGKLDTIDSDNIKKKFCIYLFNLLRTMRLKTERYKNNLNLEPQRIKS